MFFAVKGKGKLDRTRHYLMVEGFGGPIAGKDISLALKGLAYNADALDKP